MGSVVQSKRKLQKKKTVAPPAVVRSAGLCSTCNNRPTCVLREKRGYDALFCEEFDDFSQTNGDAASSPTEAASAPAPSAKSGTKPQLKGLCVNCEHRDDCVLPRPEGGVWHCEEYE
jgi:hypothetical protein